MIFRLDKGKFCSEYISFIPPEGFNMHLQTDELDRSIKFTSIDGSVVLTVRLEQDAASGIDGLVDYLTKKNYYILTEPCEVKRGNSSAFGAYYGQFPNSASSYREVHNFRFATDYLENRVSVEIEAQGWRRNKTNPIYEILGMPPVKSFLDSVEYYK